MEDQMKNVYDMTSKDLNFIPVQTDIEEDEIDKDQENISDNDLKGVFFKPTEDEILKLRKLDMEYPGIMGD